jgi:hypothetical protein
VLANGIDRLETFPRMGKTYRGLRASVLRLVQGFWPLVLLQENFRLEYEVVVVVNISWVHPIKNILPLDG